ncbi:MAG: chain-length determining protein [Desulfuromonadaceae bacterium GWC2_58_13]|nr:MAG: chain-length determining protein [Desulfuromonadaceae bacterium GWC2_58_13]
MEPQQFRFEVVFRILRRRVWSLVIPAVVVFITALVLAFTLPAVYRSDSTILIEDQEIPRDYVLTTVTGFAEQRLQGITQRLMSATRLLEIINRYNLYADKREKWTNEETIQQMRRDLDFEPISSDVIDPRSGRPVAATIAFRLSYQGRDPSVVQQITSFLTSLYLEENLKVREAQTRGATRFLEEEMAQVKRQLEEIDARIGDFKRKNPNNIPELITFNIQTLDRTERDIEQFNAQLSVLGERESYLETQLAGLSATDDSPDRQRLVELRLQLASLLTRVSEEYPDVGKLRAEIAELEQFFHRNSGADAGLDTRPDNPVFVTLSAQLAGVRSEIEAGRQQLRDYFQKRDEFRSRIENAPLVEEGYKTLLAGRNTVQAKYDDLSGRYMEARVAQGLEKGQMGERFTLIEAATFPEKPISPNRMAIILLGFVLAPLAGGGMAALREFIDHSAHCAEDLNRHVKLPVLASIPLIVTASELRRSRRRRLQVQVGTVILVVVALLVFHFFIMDLYVFWARVVRKLAV